jgi:hypothetical protein
MDIMGNCYPYVVENGAQRQVLLQAFTLAVPSQVKPK